MISWRARRQLVAVGIVVIAAGAVLFSFASRFIPDPTCFDNRKNQGELGVDCGGPCASCELHNPQAVQVLWTRAVPIRTTTYALVAQVENPNEVLSSADVEYEFTLFDDVGEVAHKVGKTFLLVQERAAIIEINVETNRAPTRVEFRILNVAWQYKRTDRPNVVVEKREYRVVGEGEAAHSEASAGIANRSPFGLRNMEVDFLVYDQNGNLTGANRVVAENFAAGARQDVKSIWPRELRGEEKTVEVNVRVNVFDPYVFINP